MSLFSKKISRIEQLIVQATSPANTTESWGTILELCDTVQKENASADAVKELSKRLINVNAVVQMQAIKVFRACVNNCGKPFRIAMCNYQFAGDVKKLLGAKSPTHVKVQNELKSALLAWELEFAGDVQLSLIRGVINELRQAGVTFEDVSPEGADAAGASASSNQASDKQQQAEQEQDDIAMAIAQSLSLQENKSQSRPNQASSSYSSAPPPQAKAVNKRARAVYDFEATEDNEMTLKTGDDVIVTDESDAHWWCGRNRAGRQGFFPASFVTYNVRSVPNAAELAEAKRKEEAQRQLEIQQQIPQKVKMELDEKKLYRCLGLMNMAQPTTPQATLGEIDGLEKECDDMLPLIEAHIEAYENAEAELQSINRRFEQALQLHEQLKTQAPHNVAPPPQQYWQGAPPSHAVPPPQHVSAQQQAPFMMQPQQPQQMQQQQIQQQQMQQMPPPAFQHMPVQGQGHAQLSATGAYAAPVSQMQPPPPGPMQSQQQLAPPTSVQQPPPSNTQQSLMDLLGGPAVTPTAPSSAGQPTSQMQQQQQQQQQGGLQGLNMAPPGQQMQMPPHPYQQQQGTLFAPPAMQHQFAAPPTSMQQQQQQPPQMQQQQSGMPPGGGGFVAPGQFNMQPQAAAQRY